MRREHFFGSALGRLYDTIVKFIKQGQAANPVTLEAYFERDPDLSASIVTVVNAEDCGRTIHTNFLRRQLIASGELPLASSTVSSFSS